MDARHLGFAATMGNEIGLAVLATQSLGQRPDWDAAVARVMVAEARLAAERDFGPFAQRRDARRAEQFRLGGDAEAVDALAVEQEGDDLELDNRLYPAIWEAQLALARCPAPNIAALCFKMAVLREGDLQERDGWGPDIFATIESDLARLGG